MSCNQICPYNTLKGCTVMDRNGVCPLSIEELLGMSEQLVRTSDVLIRKPKKEKCKNYTKGKSYGYCSGVKEFDMCFCNGDKSKCDFYDEIKKENSPQKYEVVIADDNIFVVCPLKQSKKEKSMIVREIFEEIEKILKSSQTELIGEKFYYRVIVDKGISELKKKYTGEKT